MMQNQRFVRADGYRRHPGPARFTGLGQSSGQSTAQLAQIGAAKVGAGLTPTAEEAAAMSSLASTPLQPAEAGTAAGTHVPWSDLFSATMGAVGQVGTAIMQTEAQKALMREEKRAAQTQALLQWQAIQAQGAPPQATVMAIPSAPAWAAAIPLIAGIGALFWLLTRK